MARRSKPKPVSKAELARAKKELGITVPVRAWERKGTGIVLHTRNGDFVWKPKKPSPPAPLPEAGRGGKGGAGGKPAPDKGSK